MRPPLTALLLLSLGAAAAPAAKTPSAAEIFPHTVLALPAVKGIGVKWVLHPVRKDTAKTAESRLRFDVDRDGKPWFGDGAKRLLLNPAGNEAVLSSARFDDFAFLENGARVLCTDGYLGELRVPKTIDKRERGLPVFDFVGRVRLPHGSCRLQSAGPGGIYLIWHDEKSGRDELSLLKSGNGKMSAVKLYSVDSRIEAVAGDGSETFVGVKNLILELPAEGEKSRPYFSLKERVTGLAYSAKTGLFYTTRKAVGFVSPGFQMEPLISPNPEIALRGDKLYIRLSRTLGVLRIDGADLFKNQRWPASAPTGAKKS
jgi:hypothetical protein